MIKWNSFAKISTIYHVTKRIKKVKIISKKRVVIKGRKNIYIYKYIRLANDVLYIEWHFHGGKYALVSSLSRHSSYILVRSIHSARGKTNWKTEFSFQGTDGTLSRRSHCYQSLAWPILGFLIFCINNAPRLTIQETWTVATEPWALLRANFSWKSRERKIERGQVLRIIEVAR